MNNILIFGTGELQASLIKNAKEMGLYTIGIDPNPQASAKEFVDEFYVVKADDFIKTCKIVESKNINSIITTSSEKPLKMMSRIAEKYVFAFPSIKAIRKTTNKYLMKKTFLENGIPCSEGEIFNSKEKLKNYNGEFKYPVVVKPVDSSGSRGVKICHSLKDALANFKNTANYSSDDNVLIEEFIPGKEISVEGLIFNKKLKIIQFTDKIVSPPPYCVEMGHIQPSTIDEEKKSMILSILNKAILALGLNNCAVHAELKYKGEQINVIEIGPRLGGDFITSHLVPNSTGVNIEKEVIKISLGKRPAYNISSGSSLIKYLEIPIGSALNKIPLQKTFTNKFSFLSTIKVDLEIGEKVKPIKNSIDRYGYYIIKSSTRKGLLENERLLNTYLRKKLSYEQFKFY